MSEQTGGTLYIENASYDDQGTYVLKVTNSLVPDLELKSYDVEVNIVTGFFDFQSQDFQLYPNPAEHGEIFVRAANPDDLSEIHVLNLAGQLLLTKKANGPLNNLDISILGSGLYLVNVVFNNGSTKTEKIVVK